MSGRLGLLLAPGAGADRDQATLVSLDRDATAAGATVVRMDFPYRKAGRRAPDKPAVLLSAVRDEAASLSAHTDALAMGGRSMGGRMCSMAAAAGVDAAALVLISYPLHPPGKRESLRVEHFPDIRVPCLFVSGTRDAFGSVAEMEAATSSIAGPVTHVWIEGKDHGLRGVDDRVSEAVIGWLRRLGLLGAT